MVKRSDVIKALTVLRKPWILARTFAGLGRHRRLSKEDETPVSSSVAMVQLAIIYVMFYRLQPG